MIIRLFLLSVFIPFFLFSQKDTSNTTAIFKLKELTFQFFPKNTHLIVASENRIKITVKPKIAFTCKVSNGTISKINDSIFSITNPVPVKTLLSIYTIDAKGTEHLSCTKEYDFVLYPRVQLSGVACDSATTRLMLAAGSFYILTSKKQMYPVLSFKMEQVENNTVEIDSTTGCKLNKKMLQYTSKQKPGSMIYFSDLKYKTPDGIIRTEPVFRIFIIQDEPRPERFGF